MDAVAPRLYSARELAESMAVTVRTVRFYEARGLLEPRRVGSTRVYSRRDRARLALILRGKRLGFSLADIESYLELYDVDPRQSSQLDWLDEKLGERIALLERQREDLDVALAELHEIAARVAEARRGGERFKMEIPDD